VRRAIIVLGIVVGIVVGIGSVAWVAATGMLVPNDGLDCRTNQRGYVTTHFSTEMAGHARSPDEAIEQSDLWSFYDIPKSAWVVVPGEGPPANGIVRVEPSFEWRDEHAEFLVYVNGRAVLRPTVVSVGDRFAVAGWGTC
jgi:hypothetical protein